ncbi:Uncharacterised protein [Mycobacteroides abscessus subsp. abscessus]|nr:Uncharacterised protein [Mycobacteroides abscessus subsp. abscessus]
MSVKQSFPGRGQRHSLREGGIYHAVYRTR